MGRRRPSGLFLRAAGWLLLLVPLVPLRALFRDPPGTTWLASPAEWLQGLFVFGALAWLAVRLFPGAIQRLTEGLGRLAAGPSERGFQALVLAALLGLLVLASIGAFSRHPLLIDSIIQLFQAKIFATGQAVAPTPPFEAFFTTQHMIASESGWYGQYPPGHPAILVLGVWLRAPWLIPILLTLGTAWLVGRIATYAFDAGTGRLTMVLLVLSPFFWFMGASHMNHVSTLFFIALFVWLFQRWEGVRKESAPGVAPDRRVLWLAVAGLALGAAFLSRPLTAIAVGAAFVFPALRAAGRRWPAAAITGVVGFAVVASLYFLFNAATTGDPFRPGYLELWGSSHELGFHQTPWGESHTPLTGLRNELVDIGLLHGFLFEWPIPALLPLGVVLVAGWADRTWDRRFLLAFFAIPIAYFFYWHRDAFLGPRYLYEGLPFVMPLTARAIILLYRRLGDRRIRPLANVSATGFVTGLLVLSFAYSAFYSTPRRFHVYATGMASLKQDLVREARDAGVEEGLVFVAVSWGNRLIARSREAGATASVAERVYRRSDHCELEETVRRAETEGWEAERLNREMEALVRAPGEIEVVNLNQDPTLRLVPGRALTPACQAEVLYDRDGYTNYSPHLAANDPDLRGRFVFARDLGARNAVLRALYPGVPAYLYRPGRFIPLD
jgi:4-amino-4-deoxy-L-arabinose transferase-like glycosyltransferase